MSDWEEDFNKQRLEFLKGMTPEKMLRELLAHLHGDGGHHTEKVGLAQSVFDAEQRQETRPHETHCYMFEEILNKHGFVLQWQHEDDMFLFKSKTHLVMIYQWHNITRVDEIEKHDRWAIAEYEFDFVPYTEEDWKKIVKEANI